MRTIFHILSILLLLASCDAERRCARAAKKCAPVWQTQKPDTILLQRTITIDSSHVDTVIRCDELPVDTPVTKQAGKAKAKVTIRKRKDGSVKIDCDCPQQDTIINEKLIKGPPVPIEVNNWGLTWILTALSFLFGLMVGVRFLRDKRKNQ